MLYSETEALKGQLTLHCSYTVSSSTTTKCLNFKRHFPEYDPNDLLFKELLPEAIEQSVTFANLQAEELFSDMFAYAIFGESFLRAFAYMLAPGNGRGPSGKYPTYRTRVESIREIAKNEGINLPTMRELNLADEPHRGNPRDRFVVNIAESSLERIKHALWTNVRELIETCGVVRPDSVRALRHLNEFRLGVPAYDPMCLGDIINAGWLHHQESESDNINHTERLLRFVNLNELVFKTVEVLEYNRRTSDGA